MNKQINLQTDTQVKKSLGATIHLPRAWPELLGAADGNSFLFRACKLQAASRRPDVSSPEE